MELSPTEAQEEPPANEPPKLPPGQPMFTLLPEWGLQPFHELQVGLDADKRPPTLNIPHFADAILRGALDNNLSVRDVIAKIVIPHAKDPCLRSRIAELILALFADEKRRQTIDMLSRDDMLGYRPSERRAILLYARINNEEAVSRLFQLLA